MVHGYTKTAHMVWEGDGILRITILKDAEIDISEAAENHALSNKLASGRKFVQLVKSEGDFEVTPEARAYAAQYSASEGRVAMAFITSSLAQRLIGNFYIKYNKPLVPVRMFKTEESALEWLGTFLPKVLASWKQEETTAKLKNDPGSGN